MRIKIHKDIININNLLQGNIFEAHIECYIQHLSLELSCVYIGKLCRIGHVESNL